MHLNNLKIFGELLTSPPPFHLFVILHPVYHLIFPFTNLSLYIICVFSCEATLGAAHVCLYLLGSVPASIHGFVRVCVRVCVCVCALWSANF